MHDILATRPTRQLHPTEKQEQGAIVELLRLLGATVYVLGVRRKRGDHPGTMMTPGLPDLWAFIPARRAGDVGVGLWIEVKAAAGRLRPEQHEFQRHCAQTQTPYLVGGVDVVATWLRARGWLR